MLVENNFTTYLMVNILAAMYLLADKVFNWANKSLLEPQRWFCFQRATKKVGKYF